MTYSKALHTEGMEHHPWQRRARAAGLTQKMLAQITGHAEMTVSRQLRGQWESGVPQHIKAIIIAWEVMTEQQRAAWLKAIDAAD